METRPVMVEGIVDNVRRLFRFLSEHSKSIEQETNATPAQLLAVRLLQQCSPMKVSDLAKAMYVHPATVVGLLDRLEAKGLVQRTRSAEDRRVVFVDLTEQGKTLVRNSPQIPPRHLLQGLESLPEKQLEQVAKGMEQLVKIVGAQQVPPQLIMSSEINIPANHEPRPQRSG